MPIGFRFDYGVFTAKKPDLAQPCYTPEVSARSLEVRARVFPSWYKHVVVEWSVPPAWGPCVFNVYHAAVINGPFTLLNPVPIHDTMLRDVTGQDYSKFRNGYYVVEAILIDYASQTIRSPAVTWHNTQTPWVRVRHKEIQRRGHILLEKFSGVKSYLFRKRTYGQRCPDCWDPVSETVTNDACLTCFGTSFVGGYSHAIPLFVQYESTPSNVQKTYFGKFEPNAIGAWTMADPEVFPDDVLIRVGDWNAYVVVNVQPTELQTVTVRQTMQLVQLSRRDIENELTARCIAEFPQSAV